MLRDGGGARVVAAGGNFCAALTAVGGLVVWGRTPPGLLAATPGSGGGAEGGSGGLGGGGGGGGSCYSWPSSGGSGAENNVRLTGVSCGRRHVVVTDGARVWVAGSVAGWEFGENGHPEEVTAMRDFAARGGGGPVYTLNPLDP
jgi:hypothetical protein